MTRFVNATLRNLAIDIEGTVRIAEKVTGASTVTKHARQPRAGNVTAGEEPAHSASRVSGASIVIRQLDAWDLIHGPENV